MNTIEKIESEEEKGAENNSVEPNFDADDESDLNDSSEEIIVPSRPLESSSSEDEQEEEELQDNFNTLQSLIHKLNDDDHSQDEGIEDYKVGGYHPCFVGEVLINRYVLIQKLGWGHFSTVWLAKDFKYSTYVAVKIMKSAPHYLQASYDEIQILQKVAKNALNPEWLKSLKQYQPFKKKYDRDDCHVLNLLNAFLYKGPYGNHFCMVFQILGINLWEVLKKYDCKGLPINIVKQITRQVLMGLDFLNRICRVIHTDLKPENVLLCLTEDQLKRIVEDEQLANAGDFTDRLNFYCDRYGMGPLPVPVEQVHYPVVEVSASSSSLPQDSEAELEVPYELEQLQLRIEELKQKLEGTESHNFKKTLKKKIKKLQQDREKQLQLFNARKAEFQKQKQLKKKKKQVDSESKVNGKQKTLGKQKKTNQRKNGSNKPKKSVKQLFVNFKHKLSFDNTESGLTENIKVKIADLGNACWEHHHFATQIQTRQYRSPQVMLGSKYNLTADMWSLACMTFELLTGQLLFNPKKDPNETFGKNDDHLAQIMELLGRFPKKMSMRGAKGKKYISNNGSLNRIPKLQNWSLKDVMIAKYRFKQNEAQLFQDFMLPLLNCYPERRTLSHQILSHPWVHTACSDNYLMQQVESCRDYETHQRLRSERYDLTEERDEVYQYESQQEDGAFQDNVETGDSQDLYQVQKVGDIRLIDRSFTDLGYIGYGTGIFLEKLDFGPNWQFS